MYWIYFLKLALGYGLARFLIEPNVRWAQKGWLLPSLMVGSLTAFLAALLLAPHLRPAALATIGIYAAITGIVYGLERTSVRPKWLSFTGAQFAQGVTCSAIATWWAASGDLQQIGSSIIANLSDLRLLWYITIYISAILGGNEFTKRVAEHFSKQFTAEMIQKKPGLKDAGRYIGWIERFLILTFVVTDFGEAVGFLLAAKALVRYPEINEDKQGRFGEYFLVGTFTSVGIALFAGMILRLALT